MERGYNPFSKEEYVETIHGVINRALGRYITNRTKKHYFVKYKGFGISNSEIRIMREFNVNHIIIRYIGEKFNILYKIRLDIVESLETYNNDGDEQRIIPISIMEEVAREER